MANASVLATRLAYEFSFARDLERVACLQKCRHVKRETGPVQGKSRGGAWLSVFRYVRFARSSFQETNKRRKRNAGKRRVTTAASCDAARALLERARLTAFHRGSLPVGSIRPQGSASGQVS